MSSYQHFYYNDPSQVCCIKGNYWNKVYYTCTDFVWWSHPSMHHCLIINALNWCPLMLTGHLLYRLCKFINWCKAWQPWLFIKPHFFYHLDYSVWTKALYSAKNCFSHTLNIFSILPSHNCFHLQNVWSGHCYNSKTFYNFTNLLKMYIRTVCLQNISYIYISKYWCFLFSFLIFLMVCLHTEFPWTIISLNGELNHLPNRMLKLGLFTHH